MPTQPPLTATELQATLDELRRRVLDSASAKKSPPAEVPHQKAGQKPLNSVALTNRRANTVNQEPIPTESAAQDFAQADEDEREEGEISESESLPPLPPPPPPAPVPKPAPATTVDHCEGDNPHHLSEEIGIGIEDIQGQREMVTTVTMMINLGELRAVEVSQRQGIRHHNHRTGQIEEIL
ncbi:hypothetical protein HK097_001203 [Rhizophlyctis rosea]|uniref:Uncharacterized protein n=1 Tax=Rhizophlyctis rosea TaxID=64517 RepID=A0AAD5SH09_9FUNG|nr:hypothetical protein HK097_001203 [Rhizophlyctis rosea]